MVSRKFSPFIAAVAGAAIFAVTGYAQAFAGHGGHHGSSALGACMATAPKSVKTGLRSTFKSSSLRTDEKAVHTAKQALDQAILAKSTSLTADEAALSAAELKVIQDRDAIAQNVCGQLSQAQLSAASTLYTDLQSNRQTVRGYFQSARAAAGE
ncbi:MAG: hypothetical protein WCE23_01505 [Candidatus Binatus sp.]|uniref:hypothetical protein n=1 Tax=Candidatus Binatus sp. TaxID=2811406 RepID=UPI003C71387C